MWDLDQYDGTERTKQLPVPEARLNTKMLKAEPLMAFAERTDLQRSPVGGSHQASLFGRIRWTNLVRFQSQLGTLLVDLFNVQPFASTISSSAPVEVTSGEMCAPRRKSLSAGWGEEWGRFRLGGATFGGSLIASGTWGGHLRQRKGIDEMVAVLQDVWISSPKSSVTIPGVLLKPF